MIASFRFHPLLRVVLGAAVGLAAWSSRASLDAVAGAQGPIRVAMLPPLWQLAALIVLGVGAVGLASLGLSRHLSRTLPPDRVARVVDDVFLPLASLSLLALPYLPWLPDQLPILMVLAGPGSALVWIIVALQLIVTTVRALNTSGDLALPFGRILTPRRGMWAAFACGVIAFGLTASRLTSTPLYPGGDEPHYLVITQSLLRDGDFKIENNHVRGDYREYFRRDLAPHYLTRGVDEEIYSVHPVALPIALAPAYALGGYNATVIVMVLVAAGAGAWMWRWVWQSTGSPGVATFAWLALCLSAPFLFNSFAIYPEIPAALAVMLAFTTGVAATKQTDAPPGEASSVLATTAAEQVASWRWLVCGLALATLPWLSTKYTPMAAALAVVLMGRVWLPAYAAARRTRSRDTALILAPFAVSLIGWLAFFFVFWGSPLPSAAYGPDNPTGVADLARGFPGLLFDQEYGVVTYAPVLVLGLTGLLAMARSGRESRRVAIEIAMVCGALIVTVGAFHIWWGGSAAVGRPIIAGLLLLGLPVAWQYSAAQAHSARRAGHELLLLIGVVVTATLALAQNGLLLVGARDGDSRLLEWLSPLWSLWELFPSFIRSQPLVAIGFCLVWFLCAIAGSWLLSRWSRSSLPGSAALGAVVSLVFAALIASVVVPRIFASSVQPFDLEARARTPLLDEFDRGVRPIALVYDPLRRVDPATVPSLVTLSATREQRREPTAFRLLYHARYSLPAGRYTVELQQQQGESPIVTGSLELQLGRQGPPARTWRVTLAAPGTWRETFDLPLDVGFVGFRASGSLADAGPTLRLRPLSVIDAQKRPRSAEVIGAAQYGDFLVFFHDDDARVEGSGFWIPGERTTSFTVFDTHLNRVTNAYSVREEKTSAVTLGTHCGPRANELTVETPARSERVQVEPSQSQTVRVPLVDGHARVMATSRDGFERRELDPRSTSRERLGCWIEVGPG